MQSEIERFKPDIVFVCHYFPPQENVGIRRVLFWCNYFVKQGYHILVITTRKGASARVFDDLDVKVKVIEYGALSDRYVEPIQSLKPNKNSLSRRIIPSQKKSRLMEGLVRFKRVIINRYLGQILDSRLIPALMYSLRITIGGSWFSKIHTVDMSNAVIISTAPPWPMHIMGFFLARKFGCKWFLDYRDPFSKNHMFGQALAQLERVVDIFLCRAADAVFTVSTSWVAYYKRLNANTILIRNGYDSDKTFRTDVATNDAVINYFGSIEHVERIPIALFEFLERYEPDIRVRFYGSCPLIESLLNEKESLRKYVSVEGRFTYEECLRRMASGGINLLVETANGFSLSHRGVIPTKLYEYIAARRPIIALINKNLDMADILKSTGLCIGIANDAEELNRVYRDYVENKINIIPNEDLIKSFSRQNSANKMLSIIKNEGLNVSI